MARHYREKRIRFFIFLGAAILHGVLLIFVVVPAAPKAIIEEEPKALIIRLMDIQEEIPPPIDQEPLVEIIPRIIEAVAETMIESDEVPQEIIIPGIILPEHIEVQEEELEYLPMSRISIPPLLPDDQIRRAIVYPPIAQRYGIEGIVYLELLIDNQGLIQEIVILRENPENRGFGEAALNAFRGITAIPGEADGRKVGARFRYPIRFTLR